MKISIYELLGLIKEGKAPNKIKYGSMIYKKHKRNYKGIDTPDLYLFDFDFFECCNLNDEIEIIEEIIEEEKEIEKLDIQRTWQNEFICEPLPKQIYKQDIKDIENKINELIDVINDMRDKE